MFLQVTFNDGTTLDVGLSNSHTVQVVGPGNAIENAFAVSGVASVQLVEGDPPVPEAAATVEAPAQGVSEPLDASMAQAVADQAAASIDATAADATEAVPADRPVAAPEAPADGSTTSSDASATTSSEPQASTADTADPDHDAAVAQVQDGLTAAADAKPKDKAELIQVIQADIDSALANWPDSAQLQDAKAQLEQLAGEA